MHEGHRKRMKSRLSAGETLYDHELLEILLYNVCPRINTNPLAHSLLNRFCSLSEIFKADVEELKEVEGVGCAVAEFLKTVGLCMERAGKVEGVAIIKNFGDWKRFASMRLRGKKEEYLELYFIEKNGKIFRILSFTSSDRNKASAEVSTITKSIALAKPYAVLVAHNHINGSSTPSENDEKFTRQLQIICSMNSVILQDHLIYAGDNNIFSYMDAGRLEIINREYSLENALKWTKNLN